MLPENGKRRPVGPVDNPVTEPPGKKVDVIRVIRSTLRANRALRANDDTELSIPGNGKETEVFVVPGSIPMRVELGGDTYVVGSTRYGLDGFDRVPATTVQTIVEADIAHAREREEIISTSPRVERPTRGNRLMNALKEMGGVATPVIDRFAEMHYDVPQGEEEHVSVVVYDHSTYGVGGVLFGTLPMEYISDPSNVVELIRLDMAHMRARNALLRDSVESTEREEPTTQNGE